MQKIKDSTLFSIEPAHISLVISINFVYYIEKQQLVIQRGSFMQPSSRNHILDNALASSRMEGYQADEQTRRDCLRLMNGKVDARTLAAEILARRREQRN